MHCTLPCSCLAMCSNVQCTIAPLGPHLCDECLALLPEVPGDTVPDGLVALGHPPEQLGGGEIKTDQLHVQCTLYKQDYLVHAGQVIHPVVLEHVDDP